MNRFLGTMSLVSVTMATPQILAAQAVASPVTVSIAAGAAMPMGDLDNIGKTGITFGGGVEFGASTLPVGLRAELGYTRFGKRTTSFSDPDVGSFSAEVRPSNLNLNLNAILAPTVPAAQIRPYAIAGIGFYNSTIDIGFESTEISFEAEDSQGSLGFNGGAGVRFQFVGFSSFIEARYHHVLKGTIDENSTGETPEWKSAGYLPIVFGISIGG
jgi:opacity protein-like surface antigen